MKAVCVTADRRLVVRDIPTPLDAAPGHVLVDIDSATVTHGDKFFLSRPLPGPAAPPGSDPEVYGANAAGRIVAVGEGVPGSFAGRRVAIYKTLGRGPATVGVWCDRAQVPLAACLLLPEDVPVRTCSGSFANALTALAFLAEIAEAGHRGVVITAGSSATGRMAAFLARRRGMPAILLTRSAESRDRLLRDGAEHVLDASRDGFEKALGDQAERLGATAVFDGVGGPLLGRIAPVLPQNSTVWVYGFLGGAAPAAVSTMLILARNLAIRRFSNVESATVRDAERLAAARAEIEGLMADPVFATRIGEVFRFEEIEAAMAYEDASGARAILVPSARSPS